MNQQKSFFLNSRSSNVFDLQTFPLFFDQQVNQSMGCNEHIKYFNRLRLDQRIELVRNFHILDMLSLKFHAYILIVLLFIRYSGIDDISSGSGGSRARVSKTNKINKHTQPQR